MKFSDDYNLGYWSGFITGLAIGIGIVVIALLVVLSLLV